MWFQGNTNMTINDAHQLINILSILRPVFWEKSWARDISQYVVVYFYIGVCYIYVDGTFCNSGIVLNINRTIIKNKEFAIHIIFTTLQIAFKNSCLCLNTRALLANVEWNSIKRVSIHLNMRAIRPPKHTSTIE